MKNSDSDPEPGYCDTFIRNLMRCHNRVPATAFIREMLYTGCDDNYPALRDVREKYVGMLGPVVVDRIRVYRETANDKKQATEVVEALSKASSSEFFRLLSWSQRMLFIVDAFSWA